MGLDGMKGNEQRVIPNESDSFLSPLGHHDHLRPTGPRMCT